MVSLRRGRGPRHAWKAIVGTEEARPGPPDWSPAGGGGKAQPEPSFELRSGVGLVHSTDEAVEGDETRRGKGPAWGDLARGGQGPDTEPGSLAAQPRAGERGGPTGRPDPVHWLAASCRHHGARTGVPATEAAGKCGGRWDDGGGVRAGPGGQPPGSLHPRPHAPLPATAGSACLHPESRWRAAPARRADSGGQDRSGCSRRASQRRLRVRFPRLLLRLPAKTEPAYGSFGAAYGADEPARELGARCRPSQLFGPCFIMLPGS